MTDAHICRVRRLDGRRTSWLSGTWMITFIVLNILIKRDFTNWLDGILLLTFCSYFLFHILRTVPLSISDRYVKVGPSLISCDDIKSIHVRKYKFTMWLDNGKLITGWCQGNNRETDARQVREWAIQHNIYKHIY